MSVIIARFHQPFDVISGVPSGELGLHTLAKLDGFRNAFERFLGPAGAGENDRAVVQDPTQDSLFDTDGLQFRKDEFECVPDENYLAVI